MNQRVTLFNLLVGWLMKKWSMLKPKSKWSDSSILLKKL